ncbi:MAG: hypothetical protein IJ196_00580 [Prevotella sp.]|nr:hypothetical protein [Prevotella sp.]
MKNLIKNGLPKYLFFVILGAFMLLTTGCNPQKSEAKKLATHFIKEYVNEDFARHTNFMKLDSTYYVTDSVIGNLRQQADTSRLFKTKIAYGDEPSTTLVYFLQAKLHDKDGEEHLLTFYYDLGITRLLAVKGN